MVVHRGQSPGHRAERTGRRVGLEGQMGTVGTVTLLQVTDRGGEGGPASSSGQAWTEGQF